MLESWCHLVGDGRALCRCEGRTLALIQGSSDPPRLVRVGIDAAIVAQHEVCRTPGHRCAGSGVDGTGR